MTIDDEKRAKFLAAVEARAHVGADQGRVMRADRPLMRDDAAAAAAAAPAGLSRARMVELDMRRSWANATEAQRARVREIVEARPADVTDAEYDAAVEFLRAVEGDGRELRRDRPLVREGEAPAAAPLSAERQAERARFARLHGPGAAPAVDLDRVPNGGRVPPPAAPAHGKKRDR